MQDDEILRQIAQRRVTERRGFFLDLGLFVVINVVIWGAWLLVWPPEAGSFPWPIFVTIGWGIGLTVHGLMTYWILSGANDAAVEREMRKLRERGPRTTER